MSLILNSTGGGSVTINEPTTASNFTQTLPAADGVTMVSGNMPVFGAYQSTAQTLASSTYTKLLFQTEEFDTNNNFASSTFTPTVAGYYQFNGAVQLATTNTTILLAITKNGSLLKFGGINTVSGSTTVNSIVFCNGTTDYIELYAYFAVGQNTFAGSNATYFNGCLVRTA